MEEERSPGRSLGSCSVAQMFDFWDRENKAQEAEGLGRDRVSFPVFLLGLQAQVPAALPQLRESPVQPWVQPEPRFPY